MVGGERSGITLLTMTLLTTDTPSPLELTSALVNAATFAPQRLVYSAWTGHLPFAHFVMQTKAPAVFVELGTHNASSYFSFCQSVVDLSLPTRCFAVDTWVGDEHAGHYDNEVFQEVSAYNQAHYERFSSLLPKTFDEALADFAPQSIDLLHIDGLHTYDAVKHDFETWLPKLAPGAVVLFHDTHVHEKNFGVWQFWDELKAKYPLHFDMHHSFGLGVLQIPLPQGIAALGLFDLNDSLKTQLADYFACLGAVQQSRHDLGLTQNHVQNLTELQQVQATSITELQSQIAVQTQTFDVSLQAVEVRLGETLGELNHTRKTLDNTLAAYQENHEKHARDVHALRDHIHAMEISRSWRLTSPLRALGRAVKRRLSWVFQARRAVKRKGGWGALFDKGMHILKTQGLTSAVHKAENMFFPGELQTSPHSQGHDRRDFAAWSKRFDTLTQAQREWIRAQHKAWENWPVISVLMPTYNTPPEYLTLAIESVRRQLYPKWELCIADDASPNPEVRQLLKDFEAMDPRIRVVYRDSNGHICEASNSALALVRTDWVALLDHDDELAVNALYEVAKAIVAHPNAQMFYSDEDKIDGLGVRYDPHFKSDWNPELFFAQNYISHLGVYPTQMVKTLGGFRPGLEGSQDHDLMLRCVGFLASHSNAARPSPAFDLDNARQHIVHIPKILYHWRAIPGSTAMSPSAKDYTNRARLQALEDFFKGRGMGALVHNGPLDNTAKVDYPLPSPQPLVSLLIPTKDRLDLVRTCVESILQKTTYAPFEILILDNASVEVQTLSYFAEIVKLEPRVRVIRDDRPFNFSAINNLGVKESRGALIGLINNDIEVISPEWLTEMVRLATQSDIGCVGAKLYYPSNKIQHAGVVLGILGVAGHSHKFASRHDDGYFGRLKLPQAMSAVTAACLLVRREVYDEVQGLDEENLKVAFNDVDFCLKVRSAGYRNVWTPYAELYHHESVSRGLEDTPEKKARFEKEVLFMKSKWGETLLRDPYYNPNLTLEHEDFSLSWNQP